MTEETTEVTLGETYRMVRELRDKVSQLSLDINTTFVRADLYTMAHEDMRRRVHDLELERVKNRDYRRNLVAGLFGSLVVAVASLATTLVHVH